MATTEPGTHSLAEAAALRRVRRDLERVGDLERMLAEARHDLLESRELAREVAGDPQRQEAA